MANDNAGQRKIYTARVVGRSSEVECSRNRGCISIAYADEREVIFDGFGVGMPKLGQDLIYSPEQHAGGKPGAFLYDPTIGKIVRAEGLSDEASAYFEDRDRVFGLGEMFLRRFGGIFGATGNCRTSPYHTIAWTIGDKLILDPRELGIGRLRQFFTSQKEPAVFILQPHTHPNVMDIYHGKSGKLVCNTLSRALNTRQP